MYKNSICARVRPFGSQRWDHDFYVKESTKPLFAKHELLAVENLYRLRCLMEFLKIIKKRVQFHCTLSQYLIEKTMC